MMKLLNKPLTILFLSLAIAEIVIMVLLDLFFMSHHSSWLPAFFDASLLSLVAIAVVSYQFKNHNIVLKHNHRSEWVALEIGIIVFSVEAVIMLLADLLPVKLSFWQLAVADTLALSVLSSGLIYFFILKPSVATEDTDNTPDTFEPIFISSLLGFSCFTILFLMVLVTAYSQISARQKQQLVTHNLSELKQTKHSVLAQVENSSRDLLTIANHPDLKEFMSGDRDQLTRLQQHYSNIIKFKPYFEQIRILNKAGYEEVRVERKVNAIKISQHDELQDKSQRYYFQHTNELSPGDVFISPLDLNVEKGAVEIPFKPVIRLATQVHSSEGEKKGIAIINLHGDFLLNQLRDSGSDTAGKVMLVNSQGYWLFGGGPDNWAFMFDDKTNHSFSARNPDTWNRIREQEQGNIETQNQTITFQTIRLPSGTRTPDDFRSSASTQSPAWKLINLLPDSEIESRLTATKNLMIVLFFSVSSLIGFAIFLLGRSLISRRKYQESVRRLAFHDHLTGLCNRRLFNEKMEQELARARRDESGLALMYFDLDHFKAINDELGHDAGDEALKETARRLKSHLRDCDIVARLGGDEFAAILPRPGDVDDLTHIAERILSCFEPSFDLFGYQRNLGLSIGIAILTDKNENSFSFTKRADQAMYEAKRTGRNCANISPGHELAESSE